MNISTPMQQQEGECSDDCTITEKSHTVTEIYDFFHVGIIP